MSSNILNVQRLVLWLSIWSVQQNVPCTLENVFCCFSQSVLQISIMCHLRPVFPYWFSAWIIYPLIRSSTIIVLVPIFPLMCVNSCFIYLSAPMLGAYIFTIIIFLVGFTLLSLYNIPLCFFLQFCFKVHFALQHQLFFVPFHLDEISFHFQSACVLRSEMSLFCSASIHINVYRCASIHILGGIHSPTLYFLIRPFSPFSFKVISDRSALIAVLLNVFW